MYHGSRNEFLIVFLLFFVQGILKIDWSPPSKFVFAVTWNTKLLAPSKFHVWHALLNRVCGSNLMHFKIS
jgi:hypothetical protein